MSVLLISGTVLLVIGVMVMAGWLLPSRRLVEVTDGWVVAVFNSGLAFALLGVGLLAAAREVRPVTLVAGLVVVAIGVATLLQYMLFQDFGIDQWFVDDWLRADTTFPGRVSANTAALFVAAGVVLVLGGRQDSRDAAGVAAWGTGILLMVAGLAATFHFPDIEWAGWAGFKAMSLPEAAACIVAGFGLFVLAKRWNGPLDTDLRSKRFGALIFLLLAAVGVNLWQALASVDLMRTQAATQQAARSIEWQLTTERVDRYNAFRRLVARFVHGEGRFTPDDWAADAYNYIDQIGSIRSLLLIDGDGHFVRLVTRRPELAIPSDRFYAFDEQRREMLARAYNTMQLVMSPPMEMRLGGLGFQMVMPFQTLDGPMAMVVGMAYDETFDAMLSDAVPGYGFDIHIGGTRVYHRSNGDDPSTGMPVVTFQMTAPGNPWVLRVWPLREDRYAPQGALPLAVLLLGLIASFLVAVAFRFAMLARARLATALEATERLQDETAISATIWRYSRDVLCTTDREGRFVRVSAAAQELWGYAPEELEGRSAIDLVVADDVPRTERVRDSVPEGTPVYGFVNRMQHRSGAIVYVSWSAQWSDELGLNVAIARNITALMEREREIAASEERLRVAVEQTGRLVYDHTRDGQQSTWVGDPVSLLGMTRAQLLEMSDAEYWQRTHPDDRAAAENEFTRVLRDGGPFRIQYRWQRPDGRWVWIEDAGSVLEGRLVAVKSDITEQREVEEQLERRVALRTRELVHANTELESFSYSVSHDLRTPLRAIAGFTELLREQYADQLDTTGTHYLARIESGAARMGMLIDDLLTLGQVSRRDITRQVVDLSGIANAVLSRLQETEPARTVDFRIKAGLTAKCDPRLAEVVLDNLLGNAWKFTRDRDLGVITFDRVDGAFRVQDNGVGFDNEHAGQLFGVFQRLHAIHEFPGTGIGLATVKRIVERHGGTVWAHGEVGKGASFYFTFAD